MYQKLKKLRAFEKSSQNTGSFERKLQSRRLFALLYGNISNTQYTNLFRKAEKYSGKIGVQFVSLVEKRLDVVIMKMFHFPSFQSTRQYIGHQGILVNNKIVNLSNYFVQPGDIIQIQNPENFTKYIELSNGCSHPHLEVNYKTFTGIFLFSPTQIYYPLPKLVCREKGISMER